MLTRIGVPAVLAALLLMAGPAWAQHRGGGGHGGGFHAGGFHSGGFHAGGFHGGGFHAGGSHFDRFHVGSLHRGDFFRDHHFRSYPFHGYYPFYGYYYPSYGYYPSYSYYPSYDLGGGSTPDLGYYDSYGGAAPSDSGSYQATEPPSTVSPNTASAQIDSIARLTVKVPANAKLWFNGSITKSTGSVREFQSPPLAPGRYSYEVRARWTENGRETTQTQKVAVTPGVHITVDFPNRSGTN
jgi:uncharacterized protein (TIGR03000 family)